MGLYGSKWNTSTLIFRTNSTDAYQSKSINACGFKMASSASSLKPSHTYMGICMLLDHTPICVIKVTSCPNKLASFLTLGILNKTEAPSVARAGSHGIPISFQGIFTRLEEHQPIFNLYRFELVL